DVAGRLSNFVGNLLIIQSGPLAGAYSVNYQGGDGNDVVLTAVNTPPTFTKGPDQSVTDESPTQLIKTWATNISAGPSDEVGQNMQFVVTTDNSGLFAAQPMIDPASGNLTFKPLPNVVGTAHVTVKLMDDGGS